MRTKNDDPDICIALYLKEYLSRSRALRGNEEQLFIRIVTPYKAVSRNIFYRWIKRVMEESGIDVELFKAHGTRAASCSKAKRESVCAKNFENGWMVQQQNFYEVLR